MNKHYSSFRPTVYEVLSSWKLSWGLSCIIKYAARADFKGQRQWDLLKIIDYAAMELGLNDGQRFDIEQLTLSHISNMPVTQEKD